MTHIIAHRGFSGKYPENTLLAIRKAVELGVDWIEIDVWLTSDHNMVVIHDHKLNRTTAGKGWILKKPFSEIRKYKIEGSNEKIPSLEEVLNMMKKSNVRLNIEIKNVWAAKPVVEMIKKHNIQSKVMVSSSSIFALKIVRREMPSLKTAYIFFTSSNAKWGVFVTLLAKLFSQLTQRIIIKTAKSLKVDYVHPSYPFAVNGFIKKLKKHGFKVNVWTVNTKPLMRKVIKKGVDGIITNHPDQLKAVLSEKPKTRKIGLRRIGKKIKLPSIRLRRKKARQK
ncbi:hypothetical protein JW756_00420 [Candidatus Woesearchaeota archaeon]|nr:hypothetical protein [Candidatus Woesearchaeota archaeon]